MASLISGFETYAPDFKVEQADSGEFLPRDSITRIEIDEDLDKPALFRISLNEEMDITTQKFRWLDDERIRPGTEIIIHFGYALFKKQGLFRGKIKALSPGFLSTGIPSLSIEGYDLSYDLQKTRVAFNNNDVLYSTVAMEIAVKNGLSSTGVELTKTLHEKVERKKNEHDYAILKRLSREIGFEFFVRDMTLYFREPRDIVPGTVTFEFRKNFINFSPRMTTAALVNDVKVTAWNNKDKKSISETASISDIKSSVGIPDFDRIVEQSQGQKINVKLEGCVVNSNEEAKTLARAELKRRNRGFIEGTLECIGDPQLRPGMTVNIMKVGKRFSGVYYVNHAKHTIDEGGYRTTLDMRRSVL